ncbi:LUC7 domain containing protein [Asbolus verrucosus]|uniref:LUC7 domain containing protein n=1 Tax=Asbolus verrucosus TaxID=1661398 RepID=A0A482VIC5_ASBVE|nr:LUC7 domain containing protein [Asbolus verrucosus]
MAVLAAAQLLDELMGRNRNVAPNEKVKELNWEDPEYCKYFMVKFCPHDLFVNTRADLGACSKVHDEEVRKMFQQAKPHRKIHYQEEFIRFCSSMINEVERKIQKGKMRLALSGKAELPSISPAQSQKNQEQIKILNERINGLEAEAEQAGTDGNVEQAQGLMKLCDQLKEERDSLRKQIENGHWNATAELAAAQEKQMEVCQVCGAFLIVGDAQQRIDDHLMGKQHVGFARLKSALEEITTVVQAAKEERRLGRGGGLGSDDRRSRELERERERERDREKRREKDLERSRSEHRVDKEKERREKDKEREKERKERERRDREAHRSKEREREREKDRERDRKHRSDRDSGI